MERVVISHTLHKSPTNLKKLKPICWGKNQGPRLCHFNCCFFPLLFLCRRMAPPNYWNADVKLFWREAGAEEYAHVKKDIHIECAVYTQCAVSKNTVVAVRQMCSTQCSSEKDFEMGVRKRGICTHMVVYPTSPFSSRAKAGSNPLEQIKDLSLTAGIARLMWLVAPLRRCELLLQAECWTNSALSLNRSISMCVLQASFIKTWIHSFIQATVSSNRSCQVHLRSGHEN